ncbi:MAG: LysR family transcriptional regulator [Chthoniobacteraceae bacterium]
MNSIHSMSEPLDSRLRHAFTVLARTGSFSETARELHPSQSAVSHSRKALESEVGCRLLDNVRKKAAVIQPGGRLLGFSGSSLASGTSGRLRQRRTGRPPLRCLDAAGESQGHL